MWWHLPARILVVECGLGCRWGGAGGGAMVVRGGLGVGTYARLRPIRLCSVEPLRGSVYCTGCDSNPLGWGPPPILGA
eukprot:4565114-Alexandrium_andersonii.AAC.1